MEKWFISVTLATIITTCSGKYISVLNKHIIDEDLFTVNNYAIIKTFLNVVCHICDSEFSNNVFYY